ncbi:type II secretion system protein J [Salinibacterium sp. ZJ70]|uniref:PulJ/GspJ family protein n=1 Tax=Salinibacterium sp. ZJ70 TaxID=2708084 RepID=UPI0014213913|nr:prepilin-type N-terminal cleavage/methylation domain-containing protein [Salinibacterium sp. ZJ70]
MRALSRRLARLRATGDRGLTLTELIVSLTIFAFVLAIGGVTIVQVSRATVDAKMRSESATNVLTAFQYLDRQVRYADAINFAGIGGEGAAYVEFRIPRSSRPPLHDGTDPQHDQCVQWRFLPDSGALQVRQWDDRAGVTLPEWATRARLITSEASREYPFQMIPARAGSAATQSLRIQLEAGGVPEHSRTRVDTRLVARNSSLASTSNLDGNGDGVSDVPVCSPLNVRS